MVTKTGEADRNATTPWHITVRLGVMGIGVEFPLYPTLLAEVLREEIVDPLTLLLKKTLHTVDFAGVSPSRRNREKSPAEVTVDALRRRLLGERTPPRNPTLLKVSGVFSPAVLLNSGWWDRTTAAAATPVGHNDVQRWMYAGFDEWGPSWDYTSEADSEQFFLGQLGAGDEANSMLVVAVGERSRNIKAGILGLMGEKDTRALPVDVTGLLCHRSHLQRQNPQLRDLSATWPTDFNYCLLLDSKEHRITPVQEVPDFYSAYLWQCWCATECVPIGKIPTLDDCYFVWEHTDLTKPGAIRYNIDSLDHKVEYLRREYGQLILLQKSGPMVSGKPRLPTAEFQHLIGEVGRLDQPTT